MDKFSKFLPWITAVIAIVILIFAAVAAFRGPTAGETSADKAEVISAIQASKGLSPDDKVWLQTLINGDDDFTQADMNAILSAIADSPRGLTDADKAWLQAAIAAEVGKIVTPNTSAQPASPSISTDSSTDSGSSITCPSGTPVGAGEQLGPGQVYLASGPTPLIIEVQAQLGAACTTMIGENVLPIAAFVIEGGDAGDCVFRQEGGNWQVVCPADGDHDMIPIPFTWDGDQNQIVIGPLSAFGEPVPFDQIASWLGWSNKPDRFGVRYPAPSVFLAYIVGEGGLGGWAPAP